MGKFPGFSTPTETYLPVEFWEVLPQIDTVAELKVLLVVLEQYFRAGVDAMPLPLDHLVEACGLVRQSVLNGLDRARTRGTIRRRVLNGTRAFGYEPRLKGPKFRLSCHESSHDTSPLASEGHAFEAETRAQIYKTLVVEFGVACRVAENVSSGRDPAYVLRHIAYARHAVGSGFAKSRAGYVIASIRDDWGPPLGYVDRAGSEKGEKRWYTDEEFEWFFNHDGDPRFPKHEEGA